MFASSLASVQRQLLSGSGSSTVSLLRTMSVTAAQIEAKLREQLQATTVDVVDTSGGCGASFSLSVVSPKFEGLKLIQRHRAINEALRDEIAQIHALQIQKCHTPEQAAKAAP